MNQAAFDFVVHLCQGAFVGMILVAVGIAMVKDQAKRRLLGQCFPIAVLIVGTLCYYAFIMIAGGH